MVQKSQSNNEEALINDKKIKTISKLKKFEFANIKISKMTHNS